MRFVHGNAGAALIGIGTDKAPCVCASVCIRVERRVRGWRSFMGPACTTYLCRGPELLRPTEPLSRGARSGDKAGAGACQYEDGEGRKASGHGFEVVVLFKSGHEHADCACSTRRVLIGSAVGGIRR